MSTSRRPGVSSVRQATRPQASIGASWGIRSALGPDLVLIGTYFGHSEGFGTAAAPPQGVHEVEDLIGVAFSPAVLHGSA